MVIDWTNIIIGCFGGGGIFAVVRAIIDKRKSPYDMLRDLLAEQKKFYQERNADYEREKLDSAEKSSVIMQSHFANINTPTPTLFARLMWPMMPD